MHEVIDVAASPTALVSLVGLFRSVLGADVRLQDLAIGVLAIERERSVPSVGTDVTAGSAVLLKPYLGELFG